MKSGAHPAGERRRVHRSETSAVRPGEERTSIRHSEDSAVAMAMTTRLSPTAARTATTAVLPEETTEQHVTKTTPTTTIATASLLTHANAVPDAAKEVALAAKTGARPAGIDAAAETRRRRTSSKTTTANFGTA